MKKEEFNSLDLGDIIRHTSPQKTSVYMVTGNYGGRVTAVKTVDLTNPDEWLIVSKVTEREGLSIQDSAKRRAFREE